MSGAAPIAAAIDAALAAYRARGGRDGALLIHSEHAGALVIAALRRAALDLSDGAPADPGAAAGELADAGALPARVLPVAVDEIGSVGPALWLGAIARGAVQVWLLVTHEDAEPDRAAIAAEMRRVETLLAELGFAGEHLRLIGGGEVSRLLMESADAGAIAAALGRLARALDRSAAAGVERLAPFALDDGGLLERAMRHLREHAGAAAPALRRKPHLGSARAPLTREIEVRDEFGAARTISIPAERALTVFVDRRELVTLMTLGASPELLVLGYLRNQRLLERLDDVESITVDWDVHAAAVKTRAGIERFDEKTARRVVTTGCGQGTVFGDLMGEIDSIRLPPASDPDARIAQSTLYRLLDAVRRQESTYKSAGSVHGCALFRQGEMLTFVEDVGRHNALDIISGWMWLNEVGGADKIFYTTGRLTSEMVIKSAQIGVPIVVSRSGITQMGLELAQRLGLALFGRATNRHFICYCGFDRFEAQPEPPRG